MNWILWIAVVGFWGGQQGDTDRMRADFHQMESQNDVENFIFVYQGHSSEQSQAYVAGAMMRMAEFVFLPTSKLKHFHRGKKKLEAYIETRPHCIEGRYVRLLVQSHVPGFLGYKDNRNEDKGFILSHIKDATLSVDYKERILKNVEKCFS